MTRTHEYTSAWYLTDIISPSKKDHIIFNYSPDSDWLYAQPLTETLTGRSDPINASTPLSVICGTSGSYFYANASEYEVRQFYLTDIVINGNTAAEFTVDDVVRKDLRGRYPLKTIDYTDGHAFGSSLQSKIKFSYSYFTTLGGTLADTSLAGHASEDRVRLKLNSVHMLGNEEAGLQKQVYSFDYIEPDKLPLRSSYSVDFWGYYNGELNSDLVPALTLDDGTVLSGANRSPSINFAKIGTLNKIHYPTGGNTEFNYSLHSTAPTNNTFFEEVPSQLLNLTGGIDPADTYDYIPHDDFLFDTPPSGTDGPKGDDKAFFINSTELPAKVRFELIGTPIDNFHNRQYIELYKSFDNGQDCTTPICPTGPALTFHELTDPSAPNPIERIYFDNPFAGTSTFLEIPIYTAGAYRVLALNTDQNVSINVEVVRTVEMQDNTPVEVGGLKVHKTVDSKDDSGNSVALTKLYYYDDLSQYTGSISSINSNSFSGYYSSSGLIHAPLIFHDFSNTKDCTFETQAPLSGSYECIRVNRYSMSKYRPVGPHISYSTVSEIAYSDTEGINGFTVYDFYNEKEAVGDIPFTKKKLANGSNHRIRVYDKDENLLEETLNYLSVRSIPGLSSSRGMIIRPNNTSQVGYRYYAEQTPNGDDFLMDYVEHCRLDETSGTGNPIFNPPPYPCTGTLLRFDTSWVRRPVSLDLDGDGVPETYANEGHLTCLNGPNNCQYGLDYDLLPIYEHPDDSDQEVICDQGVFPYYEIINYAHSCYWLRTDSTKVIRYENGNSQTALSRSYYERTPSNTPGHYQLTLTETTNSDGSNYKNRFFYPDDIDLDPQNPIYQNLAEFTAAEKVIIRLLGNADQHRINTPILLESFVNDVPTFLQKTTFIDAGASVAPLLTGNKIMPALVETSTGNSSDLKIVIQYHDYDPFGNPVEISRGQGGAPISFRWGHNGTFVIDRVENATKSEVDGSIPLYPDLRDDPSLADKIMVTSYQYDPRFGKVSSITDPNGRATIYGYDGFGRLIRVVDHKGNLRSLTEYNLGN